MAGLLACLARPHPTLPPNKYKEPEVGDDVSRSQSKEGTSLVSPKPRALSQKWLPPAEGSVGSYKEGPRWLDPKDQDCSSVFPVPAPVLMLPGKREECHFLG